MRLPIVRLQIQSSPLKQGDKPHRWYDPSRIRVVELLRVSDDGAVGELDGEQNLDVHNVTHPESRNHGRASGLSVGFTSHYLAMREMFGAHVTDGVAGENVLVDADLRITAGHLAGAVLRRRDGRDVPIEEVNVAEPCVEFSRFVLGIPPGEAGAGMREPLQQLSSGIRGFYVALAEPVELAVGDELVLR
jgi:hypothetical protein